MTLIEWTRRGGDEIEELLSMMICRKRPHAFRIRSSRGDGGIDVCVPVSPGHFEIYQIKKFAANLTANQKGQIRKSHKRIREYAATRGWTIDRWHLTLPLDPTTGNDEFLRDEIQPEGTFPCEWVGLPTIEGWVAEYPDVVDYYLNDWGERLRHEIAKFIKLSGLTTMSGPAGTEVDVEADADEFANLTPAQARPRIEALIETLNKRDPHYLYQILALTEPPSEELIESLSNSGVDAINVSSSGDGHHIVYTVRARCLESLRERPITMKVTVEIERGTTAERDFEYFLKYGRPPSEPLKTRDMSIDVPGGLGGNFSVGSMSIKTPPAPPSEMFGRRLSVLTPAGELLAEVPVTMQPPSTNHDGTGVSNVGVDPSGILRVEFLTAADRTGVVDEVEAKPEAEDGAVSRDEPENATADPQLNLTFLLHRDDVTGHFPDEVEPALAFIHHFHEPNLFKTRPLRGPGAVTQQLSNPEQPSESAAHYEAELKYVRALMILQEHTDVELRIPDLTTEVAEHAREVLRAARILRGETVTRTWQSWVIEGDFSYTDTNPFQLAGTAELIAHVGGVKLSLGTVLATYDAVVVASRKSNEDGTETLELRPFQDRNKVHLSQLTVADPDND